MVDSSPYKLKLLTYININKKNIYFNRDVKYDTNTVSKKKQIPINNLQQRFIQSLKKRLHQKILLTTKLERWPNFFFLFQKFTPCIQTLHIQKIAFYMVDLIKFYVYTLNTMKLLKITRII